MLHWGAEPEDWDIFTLLLGYRQDILPVVCNPDAKVSASSTLKMAGKMPSHYNRKGRVAGFKDWPRHLTSEGEITLWRQQSDYGFCIVARTLKGIDIDIADPTRSAEVVVYIEQWLSNLKGHPVQVAVRYREGTGKCLVPVEVAAVTAKHVIVTEGGAIEFLGNQQQFLAAGCHMGNDGKPSGTRYLWRWPQGYQFERLSAEEFSALMHALQHRFSNGEGTSLDGIRVSPRRKGEHIDVNDDVYNMLKIVAAKGERERDGVLMIDCPWKHEHTMDGGQDETIYMRAGTNGYLHGHFKCLHAHCQGRSQRDFLDAFGISALDFDDLTEGGQVAVSKAGNPATEYDQPLTENTRPGLLNLAILDESLPPLDRDKNGEIKVTRDNLLKSLQRPDVAGVDIRFDDFKAQLVKAQPVKAGYGGIRAWLPFDDDDYFFIARRLEMIGFKPIGREHIREAVHATGTLNHFDSAVEWLTHVPQWDGVKRVNTFLEVYAGVQTSAYTRAVSRYLWTALAGRVLKPGIKADMVPILEGPEGVRKTSLVHALSPSPDFVCDVSFDMDDDDLGRVFRGKFIAEVSELRGLKTKDEESIKGFTSRTHDEWIPKYMEFSQIYPRRVVLIGTTNEQELFAGGGKKRRWLPVHVEFCHVDDLIRDRLQLWAEAKHLFLTGGVDWEAERLSANIHEHYHAEHPWETVLKEWLERSNPEHGCSNGDRKDLTGITIARECDDLHIRMDRGNDFSVLGKVMRSIGYQKLTIMGTRYWRKK